MALTTPQLQTLKADMAADPVLSAYPHDANGAFDIAAIYNQPSSPAFYVWRTMVVVTDLMGEGFDWTRVDNLTVGKARIWQFMTAAELLNPSQANVRAGFEACFSIEAADQPCRQAIYNGAQKQATRAEKLYATGAGTAATHHGVGPAVMSFQDQITYIDIQNAWELP